MTDIPYTQSNLFHDLKNLGIQEGDGLFVHASLGSIGPVIGGPRVVVQVLMNAVGETGLVGMPGFSSDAYFPADLDKSSLGEEQVAHVENAVPGFDQLKSPCAGMGIIAETFRTWPGTVRSDHPAVSICLNGSNSDKYLAEHSLAWATGENTPLGKLRFRHSMKTLLIGVGWNRCSALHTAETLAEFRRQKVRRFKNGGAAGDWIETPDVADDMNRLFPDAGEAFEQTGAVTFGKLGASGCKVCDYSRLVDFASHWISEANFKSGDRE
ncbi:AAC(3) family N-acetyltransferase [Ruegeria sp.]|uniref:aminoglycoside N(3)-acetyltransferase n=1 Tax=Ruegeria sp. TaxID=1879320 RepID=UPI00230AF75C|nr:AAC(3) family N-acetyltransferase [Ruegeria sp.]MDA7966979.1 AAC(3) family N-acetyltransferase [Ruegeria sp.]